jgi:hypothetical protein
MKGNLHAQDIAIQTASGGLAVSGTTPNFTTGFGNVNGLGAGTPATGATVVTTGVGNGVLYTTPYNMAFSGINGSNTATVSVYVSSNFTHSTILAVKSCYPSSSCTSAGSYTTISTNSASPTSVISSPISSNTTVTGSLALFVSNTNGSVAFTGSDSAVLTFNVYGSNGHIKSTENLNLNTPSENVQNAVRLTMGAASGGLTISPASSYSTNYGNVNGLGINPASGLTTVSASGGIIYSTPYLLQPSFSSFSTMTATLMAYVNLNFVHSSTLALKDASSSGGSYTTISTSSGAQTTLTTSASSGSSLTRYLGLFVSNANGAGAFTGADSATVTYTLTAP